MEVLLGWFFFAARISTRCPRSKGFYTSCLLAFERDALNVYVEGYAFDPIPIPMDLPPNPVGEEGDYGLEGPKSF